MDKHINQLLTRGLSTLKYILKHYENTSRGFLQDSGIERTVRKMDILVTAFGEQEDVDKFNQYKKENWLSKVAVNVTYTQDELYGEIKDVEFLKDYLDKEPTNPLGDDKDTHEVLINGLGDLLELFSLIFNNWKSYEPLIKNKVIVEDVPEETMAGVSHVQEFDYEELIKNGGTPNYTEDEQESGLAEEEPEEPTTRVERRRKRRVR